MFHKLHFHVVNYYFWDRDGVYLSFAILECFL